MYRAAFRVVSAAFSWLDQHGKITSEYVEGENAVYYFLERIVKAKIPIVAHNAQFEMGVIKCRFPDLSDLFIWLADTMRLVQNYDNGGDPFALETLPPMSLDEQLELLESGGGEGKGKGKKPKSISGLSLVKAVKRILKRSDHKEKAHKWIQENVPEAKNKKPGRFLGFLPPALLQEYNIGDTEETLRLYVFLTDFFKSINFDWKRDHAFYFNSVRLLVAAKIRGVLVGRERLKIYRDGIEKEIEEIGLAFTTKFADPIRLVERGRLLNQIRKRKTFKGRKNVLRRSRTCSIYHSKEIRFNVGSNKQLESLFVDQLKMPIRFITAKGKPAFRSAVLDSWGEGGTMLKTRRKRMLVLKQSESLIALSEYDGRIHWDLKAAGTASSRFAGGQHG